jgi:outer membrane protein OmpA-like peptidoglycan-associated protein
MKLKHLLFFIFLIISRIALGQHNEKDNQNKSEKQAEDYFTNFQYDKAKPIYTELLKINPKKDEYNYKMGICEFETTEDKNIAAGYFTEITENYNLTKKTTDYTCPSFMLLAKCFGKLYMFDEAEQTLLALEKINTDKKMEIQIKQELDYDLFASNLFFNPVPMITSRLAIINSDYDDHTPIPTNDGEKIFFTSKRPGGIGNIKDKDGKLEEDIWVYDKSRGNNQKPYNIGQPINTIYNDATCGLSHDGKTLFIYRSSKKDNGHIFVCYNYNDSLWTAPVKMPKPINSRSIEKHAALSSNGKTIYFSSDRRRGGKGGRDIWISTLKSDSSWSKPINFMWNTSEDEESPFLSQDDKTLYFSSKGYPGMGNFDVYKSTLQTDGTWSKPENLGFPVNTTGDDVFYFPTADGNQAYYTQKNSLKSDIYLAYLYDKTYNSILVTGIIKDNRFAIRDLETLKKSGDTTFFSSGKLYRKKPIFKIFPDSVRTITLTSDEKLKSELYFVPKNSNIRTLDINLHKNLDLLKPSSDKGDYSFVLSTGKDYKIIFEAPDCIFDTKNITSKGSNNSQNIVYNPILVKIEDGKTVKIKCTAFEPNVSTLNDFTKKELDLIADCIKNHPQLFVNFSTNDYLIVSDEISIQRKNTFVEYLKNKGVASNKIYTDLSPDKISKDSLEYTIYDAVNLQKAKDDKEKRTHIIVTPPQEFKPVVNLNDLLFGENQNAFNTKNSRGLDSLAIFMKNNSKTKIEIIGYADAVGNDKYNIELSEKRAQAVEKYLSDKGVNPSQLQIAGYGEANPIALNQRKNGTWYKESQVYNRRVEFRVLSQSDVSLKFEIIGQIPEKFKNPAYNPDFVK